MAKQVTTGTFAGYLPKKEIDIPVAVDFRDDGTTVVAIGVGEVVGVGVARCNPIDERNNEIGYNIAASRALRDVIDKFERSWTERAHTKEEVAAKRALKRRT